MDGGPVNAHHISVTRLRWAGHLAYGVGVASAAGERGSIAADAANDEIAAALTLTGRAVQLLADRQHPLSRGAGR